MYVKSMEWAYEEEYRIVKDVAGLVSFPKESLKEVYFGCRSRQEDIDGFIDLVNKYGYEAKFFISQLQNDKYQLTFKNIN